MFLPSLEWEEWEDLSLAEKQAQTEDAKLINFPRILKDPEATVVLDAFGDSSVNIGVRAWVKTEDYWEVFYAMNERVYTEFGEAGLSIPFPQMDVHLKDAK